MNAEHRGGHTAGLSHEALSELELTLEHFNANHADTVLFIVRHAAGRVDADDAEAVGVDATGVDFDIVVAGRPEPARLAFAQPATSAADVQREVLGAMGGARAAVGDDVPMTSLERESATTVALSTFVSEIVEISDLTPNLREIVVAGGLDGFRSHGADQFVYLMVRRAGAPEIAADHTMAAQMAAEPGTAPHGAYYTVRTWDAAAGRLTMWVVLHGHDDGVGGWARRCEIGERVALWGPREGFGTPPDASSYLLVTDESGLAAVAALLEVMPSDATADVFVETVDDRHVVELPVREGVRITWLYRGDEEPGAGTRLYDAVVRLAPPTDRLVAFGAAESRQVTAIRKYLRHERGMPAEAVSMTGYWRRGTGH